MILDTNALSSLATANSGLIAKLPSDRPWYLPVVVIGEFCFGIIGSVRNKELENWLNELTEAVPVLDITETTADFYSKVRDQLKRDKRKIPPNDSWIAALAMEHSLPVLTRDKHFQLVEGISISDW